MIFRSLSFSQSTSGSKSSQPESPAIGVCSSLSIVNLMARSQWGHMVSILAAKCWFFNRPSTKGAAIASSAQAARAGGRDLRITVWGVWSAVKGYAHDTAPLEFRTRKNKWLSRSSRIWCTRGCASLSLRLISGSDKGLPVRAISFTAKRRTR